jgi:hypothetical protein
MGLLLRALEFKINNRVSSCFEWRGWRNFPTSFIYQMLFPTGKKDRFQSLHDVEKVSHLRHFVLG